MSGSESGGAQYPSGEVQIVVYRPINRESRFVLVHNVTPLQTFDLMAQQAGGSSSVNGASSSQAAGTPSQAPSALQPDTERRVSGSPPITNHSAQSGLPPTSGSRLQSEAGRRRFFVVQNSRGNQRGAATPVFAITNQTYRPRRVQRQRTGPAYFVYMRLQE